MSTVDVHQLAVKFRGELAELNRLSIYWSEKAAEFSGRDDGPAADMARSRAVTYSHTHRRLESLAKELDITLPT